MAAATTGASCTGRTFRRNLAPTIRERSRMSEMTWACAAALRSMASRPRRAVASSRRPPRSRYVQPTIAVSGVRSSWDSVDRNSSFTRLAVSACVRARSASSSRRSRSPSSCLRCGDVAREGAEAEVAAVRDGGDGQLQGKAAAVRAPRLHLHAQVRASARRRQAGPARAARTPRSASGRISSARSRPIAVLARDPERLLGLGVPEGHEPGAVEGDHRVQRVVEDGADVGGAGAAALGHASRKRSRPLR